MDNIGQTIYITMNTNGESTIYESRIVDSNERTCAIDTPVEQLTRRSKHLYSGQRLEVYFMSEGGVKNIFKTTVLGMREDRVLQWVIEKPHPKNIKKVQRRNFLRVPANLELSIRLDERHLFLAKTEDISGGGCSFYCDLKYPLVEKQSLSGWIVLVYKNEAVEHAKFSGELVRVNKFDRSQLGMVSFTDIQDVEREKIIRYCFERQLELRNKINV